MKGLHKVLSDVLLSLEKHTAQQCLDSICKNLISLVDARGCTIFLSDRSEAVVYVGATIGEVPINTKRARLKIGTGAAGWVAQHQKPLIISNACNDSRFKEEFDTPEKPDAAVSLIAIPLVVFDNLIGVLELYFINGKKFKEKDVQAIRPLANIVALAIPHEPSEGFAKLAEVCVRFLEEKDRYTHGHSIRVMKYCFVLADEIGMNQEQKDELRLCSLLHDIGKVIIRDTLLSKDGPLTKQEMQTIRMHPTIGFNIIDKISKTLSRKILSHHERYDGTGYPEGLKGEQIPMISRMIAISDTLDAITTERPYRGAANLEFAVSEIIQHKGSQFDPVLVDALLRAYKNNKLSLVKV